MFKTRIFIFNREEKQLTVNLLFSCSRSENNSDMRLAPVGGEYVIQRINLYNSEVLPREVSMISDGSSYNFVKESRYHLITN